MLDTLLKSLQLKMTYGVNTFIYALKQIPILKKILSDKLYTLSWLKALLTVLVIIKEVFMTFFNKFFYVALFIALPLISDFFRYDGEGALIPEWRAVLHILIFLTFAGGLMNNDFISGSMDKYYAVFLLRMDAKKHAISNYAYLLFRFFLGFVAVGIIGALLLKEPIWKGLMIPFFVVGVKLMGAAIDTKLLKKRISREIENNEERKPFLKLRNGKETGLGKFAFIGMFIAAAYVPTALKLTIPENISHIIMLLCILGGIASIFILKNFKDYRRAYQLNIADFMEAQSIAKSGAAAIQRDRIDEKTVVTSNKNGFEFLNELFVKRHRKILWRSSRNTSIILAGVIAIAALFTIIVPEAKADVNRAICENLRIIAFIMYFINKGQNYTQALFSNCDHSLLTFPIYRKGSNILKLFKLRLIEISKVNMVPASVLAAGLALLLFLSGGPENPLYYLVVVVSVLAFGIFFSVHYLVMYYLLQPYNANTEIKSGTYSIVMGATYIICYMLMQMDEIPAMGFGIVAAAFCIVYSIVACILAYTLAPKTFKLRT